MIMKPSTAAYSDESSGANSAFAIVPQTAVPVVGGEARQVLGLIESLEDLRKRLAGVEAVEILYCHDDSPSA